jgi:hypothetical protein
MRKSTLFISAVLTTFMLAVLFGVASAYQQIINLPKPSLAVETQPVVQQVSLPVPAVPSAVVNITPEQAAALASKVIGHTDLYSVEKSPLNGVEAYLVTFSSGDLVYVGLDGQILSISKLPVTTVSVPSNGKGAGRASQSNSGASHSDGEGSDD